MSGTTRASPVAGAAAAEASRLDDVPSEEPGAQAPRGWLTRSRPARVARSASPQSSSPQSKEGSLGAQWRERARAGWPAARADLLAALPGWAVARALVLAAIGVAHFLVHNLHVQDPAVRAQAHQGLFAWDAGFYRGIAQHGYGFGPVPHDALRFFPLVPVSARLLGAVLGGRSDVALIVIVWASALVLGALVHRLVLLEGKGEATARRACWCVAVFPSAFVLGLGYAEALAIALSVGMFLALRSKRWWWAGGLGLLAATARPLGVLLVVPAAVEVARAWVAARPPAGAGAVGGMARGEGPGGGVAAQAVGVAAQAVGPPGGPVARISRHLQFLRAFRPPRRAFLADGANFASPGGRPPLSDTPHGIEPRPGEKDWPGWLAAVAGPPVGLLAFLLWSWRRYGDFLLPLRVQTRATHRGQVVDPVTALFHEARGILHGQHMGSALHVPWALALVALTVVAFLRWPACYGAFATAVLAVALTSKNLDSLERYALGAFPLVFAIATLTSKQWLERAWLTLSAAALEGYALLALLNAYVP